jgi:5-methylcytosine-specific restriction endonuclease McrA
MACQHCGCETLKPKFCSFACQQGFAWTVRKRAMEAAGRVVSKNPRAARRYLIERDRACALCGTREWRGQAIPLVLDQIDGDAENWALANLRMICPNCDAQLPTYKSHNWGRGRAKRRERYAAGLSY